jgi:hypothetical protein
MVLVQNDGAALQQVDRPSGFNSRRSSCGSSIGRLSRCAGSYHTVKLRSRIVHARAHRDHHSHQASARLPSGPDLTVVRAHVAMGQHRMKAASCRQAKRRTCTQHRNGYRGEAEPSYCTSRARSRVNSASLIDPACFSRPSLSISSAALNPIALLISSRACRACCALRSAMPLP